MTSRFDTRLARLEALMPSGLGGEEGNEPPQLSELEVRILQGCADAADFESFLSPAIVSLREELVRAAVDHHRRTFSAGVGAIDTPLRMAAAFVAGPPGSGDRDRYLDQLKRVAADPLDDDGELPWNTVIPRWSAPPWQQANIALVVLGPDRGEALRRAAAPGIAVESRAAETDWATFRERIDAGEATWALFHVYFGPEKAEIETTLLDTARGRRIARSNGHPLPTETLLDHAAEIVSTPPDQPIDLGAWKFLNHVAGTPAPKATVDHDTWVEANQWRSRLAQDGSRLRQRLANENQ